MAAAAASLINVGNHEAIAVAADPASLLPARAPRRLVPNLRRRNPGTGEGAFRQYVRTQGRIHDHERRLAHLVFDDQGRFVRDLRNQVAV